ncbi:phosphotransacetylase family protein [Candidatus Omnitrophota bacterium]
MSPKRIFIAATSQNDGKTTVSLGLLFNLREQYKNIGFIKPIGQRYLEEQGVKVDEDSVLIERALETCQVQCGLKDMSPVAVERGFTEKYILEPDKEAITNHIKESFGRVAKDRELVIIEGTGHAGVGSVFDHSNATVAKLLGAKVVLISSGGVGRPIDEIMLNKALFEKMGVELLGVIVNKVRVEKFDKVDKLVRKGLARQGIRTLGVMPFYPMLTAPTMGQIIEETSFELLSGGEHLENKAINVIVGAMEPHNALNYFSDYSLVITPGDREDMITTTLSQHLAKARNEGGVFVSGIILSGGIRPHPAIMKMLENSNIPILFAKKDTYTVASKVHDLAVKVRPEDTEKIQKIVTMVKGFVDIEAIMENL